MGRARGLTDKQAAFAREYVVDYSATAAAIRAGYSEKNANVLGYETLQRPHVKAEISRLEAEKAERAGVEANEIVTALANIMRADISDLMEWGLVPVVDEAGNQVFMANGEPYMRPDVRVKDSSDLPRHLTAAVAEVTLTDKGSFKIKMHDKGAAIDKLMRHFGMFEQDNKQKSDGLAELLMAAQGTTIPIASRRSVAAPEGGDE